MADTWEYSRWRAARASRRPCWTSCARLVPELIEETADTVVIRHVYIERRMTPLNLYLQQAPDALLEPAVREYGDAIRQLAAANIFPGDMLYKISASRAWAASCSMTTTKSSA